jgi:hypothetical protein
MTRSQIVRAAAMLAESLKPGVNGPHSRGCKALKDSGASCSRWCVQQRCALDILRSLLKEAL